MKNNYDCRTPKYRKINNQRGQALVEMAFVLPIIVLLLMGIVEFGRIFNAYLLITNATREGGRIAVVGGTDAEVQDAINKNSTALNQTQINIQVYPDDMSRSKGDEVDVTVSYNLELICPIIGDIIPNPFPIHSKTVMRME